MKGYPRRFVPCLVAASAVLAVSGLLLVPTMLDLRFDLDVGWRLPGEQRLWVAAAHTAAALLLCGFAGALWSIHMRAGWRGRRHLRSGIATASLLAGTALTALGILYLGNEAWLLPASAAHMLLGVFSLVGGASHWLVAVVERRRSSTAPQSEVASGPGVSAAGIRTGGFATRTE